MGYLTAKQLSDKWGISERRIIKLCSENRIEGAIKNGMVWIIPEDTLKPSDKRSKIHKYINTEKRVIIFNLDEKILNFLILLLKKDGYIIDIVNCELIDNYEGVNSYKINYNKTEIENLLNYSNKYYDGMIFFETESIQNEEYLITEFSKKMNSLSSIILVNNLSNNKSKLEAKLAKDLKNNIGIRINKLSIDTPENKNILVNYNEIADDIFSLFTKFKNSTAMNLITDGDYLEFDDIGKSPNLETGKFYRIINNYFRTLKKTSTMWCASTMMEDEWTEEPLEMNFRVVNLEAANRGANLERIFIFSKSKIKEFRNNKTLKIYMQSNIKTMFVDYDEIKEKEPELLDIVGEGWDGIDEDTLIVDLPCGNKERGYITINKNEVKKAYTCFKRLKKYSKSLKEVLK